ncbi:hypothetical protein COLO4_21969 [Corchorus olitorius]|uniref:Uncharacterized protein n=1 Tax=Corchorus olitorius TaxID=93759 RepID=A0A1R3IPP9_9ROSI|nr:hypothetical protein COLO4_21969 [Corchorus olitorius]
MVEEKAPKSNNKKRLGEWGMKLPSYYDGK